MNDPIEFTATAEGDHTRVVVALAGELDLSSVGTLERVLTDHPLGDLELDCSDLTFLDSSGLGLLLSTSRTRAITLLRPSEIVLSVLDITGVLDLFEIVT